MLVTIKHSFVFSYNPCTIGANLFDEGDQMFGSGSALSDQGVILPVADHPRVTNVLAQQKQIVLQSISKCQSARVEGPKYWPCVGCVFNLTAASNFPAYDQRRLLVRPVAIDVDMPAMASIFAFVTAVAFGGPMQAGPRRRTSYALQLW